MTAVGGIAVLLLAGACSSDDDSGSAGGGGVDQVVYMTNFGMLGRDAYAICAEDQGFFADRDIELDIQSGSGTEENLALLISGQVDFTPTDLVGATIAAGDGVEGFKAVAAIQQNNLSAWMSVDPDIQSPRDLEGRTIGLPTGAVTELLFPTYAELAGIDLDEVEIEAVAAADLGPALGGGSVDAIGQFVVGQPTISLAAQGAEVNVFPYTDYVTDLYGVALNAATSTIEENPDLVERFRDALLEGLEWSLANPEECGQIFGEFDESVNPDLAVGELELMVPYAQVGDAELGSFDRQRVAQMIATLEAAGAVPPGVTPEDLVDFDMAP
ncbi:ABC transporter substrate-binding protein [Natronosporangium hydrolyticum]|uniref:Thiamine pyrimidine synthase n=1 Tax=Natronosporangium hydrolyticum TaxID=2811111 RepID=A0A895YB16_9ACTN|nr:ABC transporter substrate-binding protein [Natronosporangium hydrolyticum]QSB12663.1 ABC transporter substrate-binding protein [Natronosporangium hydrolyticum]